MVKTWGGPCFMTGKTKSTWVQMVEYGVVVILAFIFPKVPIIFGKVFSKSTHPPPVGPICSIKIKSWLTEWLSSMIYFLEKDIFVGQWRKRLFFLSYWWIIHPTSSFTLSQIFRYIISMITFSNTYILMSSRYHCD